jgi:hypothetical protein
VAAAIAALDFSRAVALLDELAKQPAAHEEPAP